MLKCYRLSGRPRLATHVVLFAFVLILPLPLQAQTGGHVRVINRTDQKVTIKVTDYYSDKNGERIDGPAIWSDCEAYTNTILYDDHEKVLASVFRYVIITAEGRTPAPGSVWVAKYSSGPYLDITIDEADLESVP